MSKLSFRARALDASKPMPIYLAEELPDLPDYSAINRAVPQMPSGMEKEEESEHHLQRAISGTGLIIPTPEVTQVCDIDFYEKCYPPDYKMPKQHIHMQPLWEEQEAPEYDMDSEDERWLKQQRHPELTELKFEQMMDKLEKSSGQTVVTLNEAKLLLERHDDLVIAVYDYWLNKRLTTQHPLILSVRTENRPGQSSNNPYLAFRRRTEKMQTRKNRKNDESSYEKMLKLRRDLARALNLLELVARRERAKRELVKLTALLAERRYAAGDFANQLLPDPPPRPAFTAVPLNPFRPEKYSAPHYPARPQPSTVDAPRQREKRPYKRRKHKHAPVGAAPGLRDSGVYTSSEEESPRVEPPSPPDDGPYAFRRKPGCYYEMPTSTLYGDPVDPDDTTKEGLYQHELDPRHRYTLTSINHPYPQCVGFARRRIGRGGRVILDRVATPLDDLWTTLPFHQPDQTDIQNEIENKRHRTPKEITTDYHTSGKYPWRHAFRRHLSRNPHLWTDVPSVDVKSDVASVDVKPIKPEPEFDVKVFDSNYKMDLPDIVQDSEKCCDNSVRTRKRSYSDCSDSSYDSDQSLQPVEQEFEKFIDEVNKKWLHFRPVTPPPPRVAPPSHSHALAPHAPLSVQLCGARDDQLACTTEFSLMELESQLRGPVFDGLADLSEAEMQSMLLEPSEAPRARLDPFLFRGQSAGTGTDSGRNNTADSFGSSRVRVIAAERETIYCDTPTPDATPHATPHVTPQLSPKPTHNKVVESRPPPLRVESTPVSVSNPVPVPLPVPVSNLVSTPIPKVTENNELPHSSHQNQSHVQPVLINSQQANRIGHAQRKKEDSVDEVQVAQNVQVKSMHSLQSPLPVHIMVGGQRRTEPVAVSSSPQHSHKDKLKVRLQNHLLSTQGGVMLQNGPFPQVVSLPVQSRDNVGTITSMAGVSADGSPRRVSTAPLVQLAPASIRHAGQHTSQASIRHAGQHAAPAAIRHAGQHAAPASIRHSAPLVVAHTHLQPKLKVLHAHPLTHSQRTQLLAQNRGITQLPSVVSLATLSDPKSSALFKASPGSVAQLFEIKSGQLGKGPHLVNVLRQPLPGKPPAPRLDMADRKPKLVFDATLKGNMSPRSVSVSLDARHVVRPPLATAARHHIHLNNRTLQGLQVSAPQLRNPSEPSTSITIAAPQAKTTSIPSSVVANLLQKNVQLPKGRIMSGQKIAISGPGGQALSANVQAIAFTAAQLKARQTRLIAQPRPTPTEIAEVSTTPVPTSSQQSQESEETETNGAVRRRTGDTLPMEVT